MDIQSLLSELKTERNRINQAVSALEGLASPARRGRPPKAKHVAPATGKKRRRMSPAARKRISTAMKQRWAKWKGKSAPKKAKAAPKKPAGRTPMSAAARKKLSAIDEGALGSEAEVESIVQGLNVAGRRLVYSRRPFLPELVHTVT